MDKESYFAAEGKRRDRNGLKAGRRQYFLSFPKPNCANLVLKPVCEGLGSGLANGQVLADQLWDWIRKRKRRRRKSDHQRWIRDFIEADPERTLLLTLTFSRFETLTHVKETGRRLVRWLKVAADAWVRVLERGKGGVHAHFVVHAVVHVDEVRAGLEAIAGIVRAHKKSERIGNWRVETINDPAGLSRYLTKTLEPGAWGRVSGRVITYSRSVVRKPWWLDRRAG